jgi:hypothetical protein
VCATCTLENVWSVERCGVCGAGERPEKTEKPLVSNPTP